MDANRLLLNGIWEFAPGPDGNQPTAGWTPVRVPHRSREFEQEPPVMGWYRTALRVPVGWESARLDLGRVRHYGRAYIDAAVVGEHYHLRMPWQLDLAGKVRPGEVCELTIFTHNCSGRYAHPDVDELSEGAAQAIDTLFWYTSAATIGMEGDVWLYVEDAVRLEDMYVVTSVRERTIRVEAEVCNDGAADFFGAVVWRVERGGPRDTTEGTLGVRSRRLKRAGGQPTVTVVRVQAIIGLRGRRS